MSTTKKTLAELTAHLLAPATPAAHVEQPKPVVEYVRKKPLPEQYVEHGWKLVRIKEGTKRPVDNGWNKPERVITDAIFAGTLNSVGLVHEFSSTAVLDLDAVDLAHLWLKDRGIDLDALMNDPAAVRIHSGDPARGKLVYALPTPLPTKKIQNDDKTVTVFELRCAGGQDVLPPSMNPRTGQRYEWIGDWRNLPPLPDALRKLWQDMVAPVERPTREQIAPSAELAELRKLIADKDPDASYEEWLRLGMILHHECDGSDDGLQLFDEFSSKGTKYKGIEEIEAKWNSFGNSPNPATAGSLRREAVADLDELGDAPLAQVTGTPTQVDDDILGSVADPPLTLKLVHLDDFIKNEPVSYLVQDLIEEGQLLGFIGQRKGGKSYAALDLAYAVAQGRRWANHEVMKTGRVVWVAAEGARSFERRRGPQWRAHYGRADIYVWPHPLNMRKADVIRALTEACRGAALVVIDSLRRVTPGAKENSSDELAEVLAYAEQLTRETGATVLFIAHAGKGDATVARGTSAIEDAFETAFAIEKIDDTPKFKLTPVFARDEDSGDSSAMFFKLTEIKPEGCTSSGMIVDWNTEAPPHKTDKTWDKLAHGVKVLALIDAHEDKSLSRDFIHAECRARYPEGTAPAALEIRLNEELRKFVKAGTLVEVVELAASKCVREHTSSRAVNYNDKTYTDNSTLFRRGLARVKGNPDHAAVAQTLAAEAPVDDAEAEL